MRRRDTKRDSAIREAPRGQRLGLGLAGVVAVVVMGGSVLSETVCARPKAPDFTITVRVYNYTQALPAVLSRAERAAGQVFAKAGLKVVWSDCWPEPPTNAPQEPCEEKTLEATGIRLRILPTPAGDRLQDTVFGFSIHPALASVYYESAVQFAKNDEGGFEAPPILGCVIAHEIGHLLLGSESHSFSGVMRSRWDREQLREAMMGALLFTPKQATLMQAELQKRLTSEMTAAKEWRDPLTGRCPRLEAADRTHNVPAWWHNPAPPGSTQ